MARWTECYDALASLVEYPAGDFAGRAASATAQLEALAPELAGPLRAFAAFAANTDPALLEERFCATFDINAVCALEVGWHLFGEEYARGAFLVRLRQERRRLDLPDGTELPDHLTHVLEVLGRFPAAEADDFARRCVIPAVTVMRDKLADSASPYAALLGTIQAVLELRHAAEEVNCG